MIKIEVGPLGWILLDLVVLCYVLAIGYNIYKIWGSISVKPKILKILVETDKLISSSEIAERIRKRWWFSPVHFIEDLLMDLVAEKAIASDYLSNTETPRLGYKITDTGKKRLHKA